MDLVKPEEMLLHVRRTVNQHGSTIIANHNLHSLYLFHSNKKMRDFYQSADIVEVDSIPIIFWAWMMGRRSRRFHRCTYLDWREKFWALASAESWRVFYLGGEPGVAATAVEALTIHWPSLCVGEHHGYFDVSPDSSDNERVLRQIEAFKPQILLVGMGMPKQELWIIQNRDRLPPCAILPVGAAFDYEAGVQLAAPRWLGQIGLEWLFRLLHNPRRMFWRYCVEPWFLLRAAAADALGRVLGGNRPVKASPDQIPDFAARRGEWQDRKIY